MNAEVPGIPVLGNILQLKEKKLYGTLTKWSKIYGPIYSIRIGSNAIVVLNSNDLLKEVTNHFPNAKYNDLDVYAFVCSLHRVYKSIREFIAVHLYYFTN